jgi:hypothetical protein
MGLRHPGFAKELPRQGVLVLTGGLAGGAREQIDLFNEELHRDERRPIEVWHNEELSRRFSELDPSSVYPDDKAGYAGFGGFYTAYGDAVNGKMNPREFERHSRFWLASTYSAARLLLPAVEGSVVAMAAESAADLYGAFQARLAVVRAAADAASAAESPKDRTFFDAAVERSIDGACAAAERFCADVWSRREQTRDHKLVDITRFAPMLTYPVLCLRLCEALAFVSFASSDEEMKAVALGRLRKIVVTEEGVKHPIGDRYAVSVVAIARALLSAGEDAVARCYLRETAYWVLNQYAKRAGLASVDDDETAEAGQLFAADVPSLGVSARNATFMVPALLDLSAYAADGQLYSEIENDLRYHRLHPEYRCAPDTGSQFRIDADDLIRFNSIAFEPSLGQASRFGYGQHLSAEPPIRRLAERLGEVPHLAVSLLLRDRYFPTTWRALPAPIIAA